MTPARRAARRTERRAATLMSVFISITTFPFWGPLIGWAPMEFTITSIAVIFPWMFNFALFRRSTMTHAVAQAFGLVKTPEDAEEKVRVFIQGLVLRNDLPPVTGLMMRLRHTPDGLVPEATLIHDDAKERILGPRETQAILYLMTGNGDIYALHSSQIVMTSGEAHLSNHERINLIRRTNGALSTADAIFAPA